MRITPTEEEWVLIRDNVFLSFLIPYCETQIINLKNSNHTVKRLYVVVTASLVKVIDSDLQQIEKDLKARHIKVSKSKQTDASFKFRCFFRGYEQIFEIGRDELKAEMGKRLAGYVNRLGMTLTR